MRRTPHDLLEDVDEVKRLIRRNPWMTYVSPTSKGLVASHAATLLEETGDDSISIVSHFGRPDDVYGVPEILGEEENFRILGEFVDHFETRMPAPVSLAQDDATARRIAKGTVGIRIRVTRFDARAKLSQNKPPHVRERIVAGLEDGPLPNAPLAAEMRRYS